MSRELSKADVLQYTTKLMRRKVEDDRITFFLAPSQYWILTFDDDGNALAAEITGRRITRREEPDRENPAEQGGTPNP